MIIISMLLFNKKSYLCVVVFLNLLLTSLKKQMVCLYIKLETNEFKNSQWTGRTTLLVI